MQGKTRQQSESIECYESSFQHLEEELKLLNLLLQQQVIRARQEEGVELRSLCISEQEIDDILEMRPGRTTPEGEQTAALAGFIEQSRSRIAARVKKSREAGIHLRLPSLVDNFGLTQFEAFTLIVCLAPELDKKYGRLYAYLQDDVARRLPSVGLLIQLLCSSPEERARARRHFHSQSPLIRAGLVTVGRGQSSAQSGPLLSCSIWIDAETANYLLGFDLPDSQSKKTFEEMAILEDLDLPEDLLAKVRNFILHIQAKPRDAICLLLGSYGSGKRSLAEAICNEIGLKLFCLDPASFAEDDASARIIQSFKEARLFGAAVLVENLDSLMQIDGNNPSSKNTTLFEAVEGFQGLVFLAAERPVDLDRRWNNPLFRIELPFPDYSARKRIWSNLLDSGHDEEEISELASKFRLSAGQIEDSMAAAGNIAILNGRQRPSLADLYEGCRSQSNRNLSRLARSIKPRYAWKDIVLPQDKIEQLQDICNHIRHKGLVYQDWGFDKKLSLGKGLNALFIGPSGTGKTMAAEVLAQDLGIELYKIDLSSIISKYIGETEKNLSRIFAEAEQSNAMLFFDEADALFGKRSEVRDSHDRYANIEVSYLLQKMEEHEGIVILASNLGSNIDDAFMRRMNFVIEFPFPEEDYRHMIWKSMLPQQAPVGDDLDFEFLSKKFKIAGGNIKNIVINAAFSAAGDSSCVTMMHMVKATKKELQKMGKAYSKSDFGKYCEWILD
jgi:SpoVK/Ycf46/Vps4 family AAA+-type ATPase